MAQTDPLEQALGRAAETLPTDPPPQLELPASTAGLLDVAYATLDSPVGKLLLASTARGIVRIAYVEGADEDTALAELAARISPRVLAAPRKLDEPRRELEEYRSEE